MAGFGGAVGTTRVNGLRELVRAFDRANRDLGTDLVWELEEAGKPVAALTEQHIRGEMAGMARSSSYWSAMRVGVSRREVIAYVAPVMRSNKHTPQGAILKAAYLRRMERAVEEKAGEIEKRVDDFLEDLGKEWARAA